QRVLGHVGALGVLAEVAEEMRLDVGVLAAEALQRRRQLSVPRRLAAEHEVRPVPPELLVPRIGEEQLVQMRPRFGANVVHAVVDSLRTTLPTHGAGARTPSWLRAPAQAA